MTAPWRAWMHNHYTTEQMANRQTGNADTIVDRGTEEENVAAAAALLGMQPRQLVKDTRRSGDQDELYRRVRGVASDFDADHLADPRLRDDGDLLIDELNARVLATHGVSASGFLRLLRHGFMVELHHRARPTDFSTTPIGGIELTIEPGRPQALAVWTPIGDGVAWATRDVDARGRGVVTIPRGIEMPETLAIAAVGRPLREVLSNPVLDAYDLTIIDVRAPSAPVFHVTGMPVMTLREASARFRP